MTGAPPAGPSGPGPRTAAGDRWRAMLARWAIPGDVLAAAPEDPFRIPAELFEARYQRCSATASNLALAACPRGGSVLDVGCASGAASRPLAARASVLTGVDADARMVALFEATCVAEGVECRARLGRWPDVASEIAIHDVVVSHHVVYNVVEIERFLLELTAHARGRAVLEITPAHPQAELTTLWKHFHHHVRPTEPTVHHLLDVLASLGIAAHQVRAQRPAPPSTQPREAIVAFARRRLCLEPASDPDIDRLLPESSVVPPSEVSCLWWDGVAPL